jgi:hypothetical protein
MARRIRAHIKEPVHSYRILVRLVVMADKERQGNERGVERMAMECEKTGCDTDKYSVVPWFCSPLAGQMRSWTVTEKGLRCSREDLRMFDGVDESWSWVCTGRQIEAEG